VQQNTFSLPKYSQDFFSQPDLMQSLFLPEQLCTLPAIDFLSALYKGLLSPLSD